MPDLSSWLPYLIGPLDIQSNGTSFVKRRRAWNFIGAVCTDNPEADRTDIDLSAPTGVFVQNQGLTLDGIGNKLNFTGPGVTASGTGTVKTIDVTGYVPVLALPSGAAPFKASTAPPLAASFTASNALGATLTDDTSTKTLLVTVPGNRASGVDSRGLEYVSTPGASYTFAVGFVPMFGFDNANSQGTQIAGVFVGNTAGKFIEFMVYRTATGVMRISINKFTNVTTVAASYQDNTLCIGSGTPIYLKIVDHGGSGNLDFSWSTDGKNFIPLASHARNDFLTASGGVIDRVGLVFDAITSEVGTKVYQSVFSWDLA